MIYPKNFEQKIGFDVIRTMLHSACRSSLGEQRIDEMQMLCQFDYISTKLQETSEFVKVLSEEEFPGEHFFDVRNTLTHLRIANTYPTIDDLFCIQRSLDTICKIKYFFDNTELYPTLRSLSQDVPVFPQVVKQIDKILDKTGEVKDTASPELYDIRKTKAQAQQSISHLFHNILNRAKNDGLVDKDATPTMRNGRLVIPVSPSMKRRINGIIHDESDTGKTVFIEPAEVVEVNNRIRELENEERREIIRILTVFADTIRTDINAILDSYEYLADIDFIEAKARLAINMGALLPTLLDTQIIDWSMARHPLLQQAKGSVVPLDILLNETQHILIISGPNAGGKSVCLKTVGLLQYMLQCGLLIPVAESSRCGIFDNIFIDIGDEQSLEDDLSTYSSHLLNMKHMMHHSNDHTLILIDEFGGGTEPQIGGAIAESVLKKINACGTYGVITTHYQNLKHYAKNTPGVANAAMLYDRHEMRPLFQLRIGNPGSSFAVEIARSIGLPQEVIDDASAIVGQDYIKSDKYLQDIVRDKRYWENKRQQIRQKEKKLEERIAEYEEKLSTIRQQKQDIIKKARQDAEGLLNQSNALIERTIKEIKEVHAEKEKTKIIRKRIKDFKSNIDKKPSSPTPPSQAIVPDADTILTEGSYVTLNGQNTPGLIRKISGNEAQVDFESVMMNVKLSRLTPAKAPKAKSRRSINNISTSTSKNLANFKPSIDVRGKRGDECIDIITTFIDDAIVSGVSSVSILHGTGDGILRTLIRQYLDTVPEIITYHDEHPQFGGPGITIAEFK